ncbi:MAG TPA: hypothetical protein VG099_22820 [Gemmataceae bacterium]|jgi:hypothetical protein|nr:hypothetical protein [Gemmataceae bacterium]
MTTSKNSRVTHQGRNSSFGLLANGSCGSWEIAIDETTSGAERWYAQIDGPAVAFYFEIPSVDIVGKMARFLEPRSATTNQPQDGLLVIGKDKRTPITLVKDDEYHDRFFLVIGPMDNPIVRFAIAGTDVIDIAEALKDVKKDLDDKT